VTLGCGDSTRTGSLEKRFIRFQGTAVLTGFSVVGGVGVKVCGRTGTDGRLALTGAWFIDLDDAETSGTVK